jgi:hypothetical protein
MSYRYSESVTFHPLIQILYLVMLGVFAAILFSDEASSRAVIVPIGLLLVAIPLVFGRLLIQMDESNLVMTWGYLGWPKASIPLANIEESEIVNYHPIRQFGGWGIRCGRFRGAMTGCYTVRGNRAVLLSLTTDIRAALCRSRQFLVGSQEPEKLRQALQL